MKTKTVFYGITLAAIILIASCASGGASAVDKEEVLQHEVMDGAEIVSVEQSFGKLRSASDVKALYYNVTIKNNSNAPKRYVCTVYAPGFGSGQDFAPSAEDKKIEPGETAAAKVSVVTDVIPAAFQIMIKEDK